MDSPDPTTTPLGDHFELTTHLIALAMIDRGHHDLHWLRPAMFTATIAGRGTVGFNQSRSDITSAVAVTIAGRKDYAREILSRAGLPVAAGGSYRPDQQAEALRKAARLWPVVIKPVNGKKGTGVTVGVADADQFRAAWDQAAPDSPKIVVERQHTGREARFLVADGRTVAVTERRPAHVTGDGTSTVPELVAAKNKLRGDNPYLATRLIVPADWVDLTRTPDPGEHVPLDHRGGISTGGDPVDITDDIHPSYLNLAAAAQHAIPGLGTAGVDIMARDWTTPLDPDTDTIIEINSRPAIGLHHLPWQGQPRDVAGAIVDAVLDALSRKTAEPAAARRWWPRRRPGKATAGL